MKRTFKIFALLMVCVMTVTAFASCDLALGHTYDEGNYGYDEYGHWLCCDSEACSSTAYYEEHEFGDDESYYLAEIEGEVYLCADCVCGYTYTELLDNSYLVTDTESAQAALDAAGEGATIYLQDGEYGVLYIRQNEDSVAVDDGWAGNGGYSFRRELNGVSIVAVGENVSVKSIDVEAHTYTPDGNQHSNSATALYLNSYIDFNNLIISGITFELDEGGIAFNVGSCKTEIDGLYIYNCEINGTNDTGRLIYSTADVFANVQIIDCVFNGLEQGVNINDVQGLRIEGCEFNAVASRDILITGPISGDIAIVNNVSNGGGERFARISGVVAGTNVTVTGNEVIDNQGADDDVLKITGAAGGEIVIEDNDWGTKIQTVDLQ